MEDKAEKLAGKWEIEKKELESLKRRLKKYQKLKNEKADLDELHKAGDKIASVLDESRWIKLDWKQIKRSKKNIEEGLTKVDEKIKTRKKKLEDLGTDAQVDTKPAGKPAPVKEKPVPKERDWSEERNGCNVGTSLYHWAFGPMEVTGMEESYIYLKVLDKKGCRGEWAKKAAIPGDKEFSLNSIGRWLFPKETDVHVVDPESAHKLFRK